MIKRVSSTYDGMLYEDVIEERRSSGDLCWEWPKCDYGHCYCGDPTWTPEEQRAWVEDAKARYLTRKVAEQAESLILTIDETIDRLDHPIRWAWRDLVAWVRR